MKFKNNRIAIVAPGQNKYSETFIQEQKKGLKGEIFYYYNGTPPNFLEDKGKLFSKFDLTVFNIKHKLRLTRFSAIEQAFIRSLKKNKIDVVLAQYGPTAHKIVSLCKKINLPLITHFHGYDASEYSIITQCNNYKEVFSYSKYVIAVSLSMKQRLIDLGCSNEKIVYNSCAPNSIFLDVNPSFKNSTFIAVGRFVNKKAPYYTILAFNKVLNKFPDAKLVIGGDGVLYETCVNLIRYLKIDNNVSLPGIIGREDFLGYLEDSLAFVQHSITAISGDQEGTPVAILEASAAGLPVISTQHAGIPDVIIDGKTGFLVEEHDVEMMAEKMIFFLENRSVAKQFGEKGKELVKSNFTLKKHLDVIDDLIEKALIKT
ncbi:glycosyltransferase [Flavobacterium ginsengisoli]|uniref:Glycosyltransferase n=1 Tax=Flavobacterium ginsengisoli TaxID=871694 RepID=A0ABP7FET4_9FLAO